MTSWYKDLLNSTFRSSQRENLVKALEEFIPKDSASFLDVGTGDGSMAELLQSKYPNITISGVDVIERGDCKIPFKLYDGIKIPHEDKSFDYVLLLNMLHHTPDASVVLKEAVRVCRKGIIIKDHLANNILSKAILTAMEYLNPNAHDLRNMPLNFYSKSEWEELFIKLNLRCTIYKDEFPSYGKFFDIFFGRNKHFIGMYVSQAA